MKTWACIRSIYKGIRVPCILLAFIMTVALLVATIAFGHYRYFTYSRDVYERSGLENAYYVAHFSNPITNQEAMDRELAETRQLPGVEAVLYDTGVNGFIIDGQMWGVMLLNDSVCDAFPPDLYGGRAFSETGLTADGALDIVDASGRFSDVALDGSFSLHYGSTPLKAALAGRIRYPYFHINFGSSGDVAADNFLSAQTAVLAKDTPETRALLEAAGEVYYHTSVNYFVVFSDDATRQEIDRYLEEAGKSCYILSYSEILDETNRRVDENLRLCFPLPVFLLILSTVSLFSISVIVIYRKATENAVWYLCGCSKRKSLLLIFACIGLCGAVAAALNAVFILLFPLLGDKGLLPIERIYLDGWSFLLIAGYLLLTLLIVFVTSVLLQRRTSPIQLLRRLDQ